MSPMVGIGGIYLLIIGLHDPRWIQIGGLGYRLFRRGYYGYVGSAIRGMRSRLDRHLKGVKRLHWHIDYLLRYADIDAIIYGQCRRDEECALANQLSSIFQSVPSFGSTDCRCSSHLFFSYRRSPLMKIGYSSFRRIGLTPHPYWKKPYIRASDLDLAVEWRRYEACKREAIVGPDVEVKGSKGSNNMENSLLNPKKP
jgi:Uri superfamily endonuclease